LVMVDECHAAGFIATGKELKKQGWWDV
jgi:hypothetical protein